MMNSFRHAVTLAVATTGVAAVRGVRFYLAIRRAQKLARTVAFDLPAVAPNATRRILIVGDSTAVGLGAASPNETLAGRLVGHFPSTAIENHACIGARARDMGSQLGSAAAPMYDAVLIAVGGNDILRRTPRAAFRTQLHGAIAQARSLSGLVIVVNSANVGSAPLFPWPLNTMLSRRSLRFRATFEEVCAALGADFVNFTFEPGQDPFRQQRSLYFSSDGLHPTGAAYELCIERLKTSTRLFSILG